MKFIYKFASILKSLYWNFRLFGFHNGVKFPLLVSYNTRINVGKSGKIIINSPRYFGVKIGFGGSDGIVENRYSLLKLCNSASLIFDGIANIAAGTNIRIEEGGELIIGKNFSCNKNCFISCIERIKFGNDVLLGWNVSIRDSDGHSIIKSNNESEPNCKEVSIGNHVWIASYVDILKGSSVSDNSVIAYRALVNKRIDKSNVLIGGFPAGVLRENINWSK